MMRLVFTARERERRRIERLQTRARKAEEATAIEKKIQIHKHWAMLDARWGLEPESITGRNASSVLDAWNALPNWSELDPVQFRARLCWYFGISNILPAIDAEILEFVVERAGPNSLRLEGESEPPTKEESAAWPEIS
jgi:hypothetical protein